MLFRRNRLQTWISVPMRPNRMGWKIIHISDKTPVTGLSSAHPDRRHPIPATKAITSTAKAPDPSSETLLLPK